MRDIKQKVERREKRGDWGEPLDVSVRWEPGKPNDKDKQPREDVIRIRQDATRWPNATGRR